MKTFNTTSEDRIRQLENLLSDTEVTLNLVSNELRDIKFTMSSGHFHPDELFEDIVAINERANLSRF